MPSLTIKGRFAGLEGTFDGRVMVSDDGIIEKVERFTGPDTADIHVPDNCIIFPGFIDIHVHARQDETGKQMHKETYATLAQAALHGGVVHVAAMPNTPNPLMTLEQLEWHRAAVAGLPIGVTHYVAIGPDTVPLPLKVPYKVFTGPSVGDTFFQDVPTLRRALLKYAGCDVSVHLEDFAILEESKGGATHDRRRPRECVEKALEYFLNMVEMFDLEAKICHWPLGGASLGAISAHCLRGFNTGIEVSPLYMFFDADQLAGREELWPFLQANPSIRTNIDRLDVIAQLRSGAFHYLATDHAPHTLNEKLKNFADVDPSRSPEENYGLLLQKDPAEVRRRACLDGTSGTPQLDTYGLLVAWLMKEHDFSPADIVRVCAANPGAWVDRFREGPGKHGMIEPGHFGSFTVLDLEATTTVRRADIRSLCGWSPYEGITFPGKVAMTIVKGRVEYDGR